MRIKLPQEKIYLDPQKLATHLEKLRQKHPIIVFGNGCFDLLHVGHIRYLFAAKELGNILIIAVNSDESLQKVKPDRKPITPDHERYEMIAAIAAVDYVVPLVEENPISLIKLLRPSIHTKGTDYTIDQIPERYAVYQYGGEVRFVGDPKRHSTSKMIRELSRRKN